MNEIKVVTLDELTPQELVLALIYEERRRQDTKWGEQNHDTGKWMDILMEEIGEASRARLEGNPLQAFKELTEAAAVIVAWQESLVRMGRAKS